MLLKGLSNGLVFTIREYRGLSGRDFLVGARDRAQFDTYIFGLHRYHAHQYTNGTTCDLTNQPRETEVE